MEIALHNDTNIIRPSTVQPLPYAEEWLRRRYGLSAAGAAVVAKLAFPAAMALIEAQVPTAPDRGRR